METRAGVVLMFGYASVWYASALFLHSRGEPFESALPQRIPLLSGKKCLGARMKSENMRHDMTPLIQPVAAPQPASKFVEMVRKMKTRRLRSFCCGGEVEIHQELHTTCIITARSTWGAHASAAERKDSWRGYSRFVWHLYKLARVNDDYMENRKGPK